MSTVHMGGVRPLHGPSLKANAAVAAVPSRCREWLLPSVATARAAHHRRGCPRAHLRQMSSRGGDECLRGRVSVRMHPTAALACRPRSQCQLLRRLQAHTLAASPTAPAPAWRTATSPTRASPRLASSSPFRWATEGGTWSRLLWRGHADALQIHTWWPRDLCARGAVVCRRVGGSTRLGRASPQSSRLIITCVL